MWHHQLSTPDSVLYSFQDALEDEELQKTLARNSTFADWGDPCLLDIVATWLGTEDTILWIPSYEVLMVGLVLIIDSWIHGEKKRIIQSTLWPDPETGEARVVERLLPVTPEGYSYEHDLEVGIAHQLFNRSAFDATRAIAQQKQQHKIQEQLERLLPRDHEK